MKKLLFPILTVFMLSSTTFAGDGNGGGANGPDLKGKAIPVAVDREILVNNLRGKIDQCQVDFMRGLMNQAFGVKLPDQKYRENPSKVAGRGYLYVVDQALEIIQMDIKELFYRKILLGTSLSSDESKIEIMSDISTFTVLVGQNESIKIPKLLFESAIADISYDDWGNVIEEKKVARNIRLVNSGQGIVKLKNERTGRDVAFQVDFRPYEACLVKSVQQ